MNSVDVSCGVTHHAGVLSRASHGLSQLELGAPPPTGDYRPLDGGGRSAVAERRKRFVTRKVSM